MLHSPLNRQCGTKSDYTFNSLYWVHWSHRPSPGEFLMPTTRQKHCHQSQWVCVYQQLISITILVEPRPPFPIWKGGPGFENITIVNFCKRVWPIHGLDSAFLATSGLVDCISRVCGGAGLSVYSHSDIHRCFHVLQSLIDDKVSPFSSVGFFI